MPCVGDKLSKLVADILSVVPSQGDESVLASERPAHSDSLVARLAGGVSVCVNAKVPKLPAYGAVTCNLGVGRVFGWVLGDKKNVVLGEPKKEIQHRGVTIGLVRELVAYRVSDVGRHNQMTLDVRGYGRLEKVQKLGIARRMDTYPLLDLILW